MRVGILMLLLATACVNSHEKLSDPSQYVDPFIGTGGILEFEMSGVNRVF